MYITVALTLELFSYSFSMKELKEKRKQKQKTLSIAALHLRKERILIRWESNLHKPMKFEGNIDEDVLMCACRTAWCKHRDCKRNVIFRFWHSANWTLHFDIIHHTCSREKFVWVFLSSLILKLFLFWIIEKKVFTQK